MFQCFLIFTLIELIYGSTGLSQGEYGQIVSNEALLFSRNFWTLPDLCIEALSAISMKSCLLSLQFLLISSIRFFKLEIKNSEFIVPSAAITP